MRAIKFGLIVFASAAAALAVGAGQEKPAAGEPAEARPKSMVRMDLLSKSAKELMPPKRSIFSPSAEDEGVEAASVTAGPGTIPSSRSNVTEGSRKPTSNANAALPSLSLRYIGFVKSSKAVIGLVIVQGQALAVQTGDMVGDWYKVGSITPKNLEVSGSDGVKMRFPLEGDEE
jgi:hypothetical protein